MMLSSIGFWSIAIATFMLSLYAIAYLHGHRDGYSRGTFTRKFHDEYTEIVDPELKKEFLIRRN